MSDSYYIGVDVGTASVRVCVMDEAGTPCAIYSKPIERFNPKQDFMNMSSQNIWDSTCCCVKQALKEANVDPKNVKAIAFDATCSLVVTNGPASLSTLPVGPDFSIQDQDVILWMDHRAKQETEQIKATKHPLLKYVGGQMSIEMEIPKILWLKSNMPAPLFQKAHFYDLSDWLTMRSTGIDARSFCSVACKQGYVPHGVDNSTTGWNTEFLDSIGLQELTHNNFEKMGGVNNKNGVYHSAGEPVGTLTSLAASELGLPESVVVGSGVIDAYSGWIGTVASNSSALPNVPVSSRLAAVAGTSTCHIVQSKEPVFVPGVWGPYRDVLVPGMWCAEGGQSATGELIKFVVTTHPAYEEAVKLMEDAKTGSVFDFLNARLETLRSQANLPTIYHLIKDLHFYGDLYGNRSPIADPNMRGSIVGLSMDLSVDDLARKYLAVLEFVCQQQRQIIDAMNSKGHEVTTIYLSGGQCRNTVLTKLMASCARMPVVIPEYIDSAVVLGTAMLAARAAHPQASLWETMCKYSHDGSVITPTTDEKVLKLLQTKYEIMVDQAKNQILYRKMVADALT